MADGIAEPFLRVANRNRDGNSQAALSRAAEGAVPDNLRSQFHIRIGQNDGVIFCSTLALHALAARGRASINMSGYGRGAHETDGSHLRMIAPRVNYFTAAIHQVYYAAGQTGGFNKLKSAAHRKRHAFGRL